MAVNPQAVAEADVPLFDVVVRIPSGMKLEEVQRRGRDEAGIPAERLEKLIGVLRSVPQAKIGAGVPRERADKARDQFTKAGLLVEVTPVLAVQSMMTGQFDLRVRCPACGHFGLLTEQRQCTACGVYVDKVTDEVLLRRKILEQEKAKLDSQSQRDAKNAAQSAKDGLEAAIREEIRKELEKKYGKSRGGFGLPRLAGAAVLLAVAFVGGRGTSAGWSKDALLGGGAKQDITASLAQAPVGGSPAGKAGGGGAGNTAAAAAANGGAPTGDPDIDDPLIQAAGGKRIGAEGLSLEQAVAASTTLAKSVGNTTAERALAGTAGAGGAAGAADAGGAPRAAGAAADGPAAAAAPVAPLSKPAKTLLAIEFTRQLAEMGQGRRAAEMVQRIKASAPVRIDPVLSGAAQAADVQIRALALLAHGADAAAGADALAAEADTIVEPAQKARALAAAAAVLGRHPGLSADVPRALLARSAQAAKSVGDGAQRAAVLGDWAVAFGEVLAESAQRSAAAGQWSQAKAQVAQLDQLVAQAEGSSQARLHALNHRMRRNLGEADKAEASLEAGLAAVAKVPGAAAKAGVLREVARLGQAGGHARVLAAVAAVQQEAAGQPGPEQARSLAQLAVLHASAGRQAQADELAQALPKVPGLDPESASLVQADLLVQREMAVARQLHAAGRYAETEAAVRRVGQYLL